MHVAVLVSQYPTTSNTFIRREVAALRRRGVEVQTFAVRGPPPEMALSEEDRHERERTWYVLPTTLAALLAAHAAAFAARPGAYIRTALAALRHRAPGLRTLVWSFFYFAEAILLARELERRAISHLHNHFANGGADVGLLVSRFLGIGWSLTLHGASDFGQAPGPLAQKVAVARFVVCVSQFGRAQVLRMLAPEAWGKVIVSRCGVEPARFAPTPPGGARSPVRVLCVGRLVPEKGIPGLADSFVELASRGADAELVLVGEGPERERIEARFRACCVPSRLTLLGALPEEDVCRELARADVFVLPSLMEGLPVVLMEAMAAGVPVVAPRLAGIPELVEDGVSGLLFAPADWGELAARLARLIADPAERSRLGAAGRARVAAEYDVDRAVEPLWRRLAGEPSPEAARLEAARSALRA
jgi:glycosyltransferase involved in cell wall biosynthesis